MYLAAFVIFIGIHLAGVGEALRLMFVITAIALLGLVIFAVNAVGKFDGHRLTDIVPDAAAAGIEVAAKVWKLLTGGTP